MEKLLPMEGIFEILAQNGFHQPENQFPLARMKDFLKNKFKLDGKNFNQKWEKVGFHQPENVFPLARMKDSFQNYVSTRRKKNYHSQKCLKIDKKSVPLARKCVSTSQNAFKNALPLDGKIKLAMAGVSQIGRKKGFQEKSVSYHSQKKRFSIFHETFAPVNGENYPRR